MLIMPNAMPGPTMQTSTPSLPLSTKLPNSNPVYARGANPNLGPLASKIPKYALKNTSP